MTSLGRYDADRIAEDIRDVLIKHGLRRITAMSDTHTVVVRETNLMEDDYPKLKTETKEHDAL